MKKNLSAQALLKIIDQALNKQGISARQASILATGGPELIAVYAVAAYLR